MQSENINELASALSKAQGEMQAAIKDSINPFYKTKYADLGSVWDAARPVLSKNGLCVMQSTEMVGDKIVMVTTLAHISGQWMKSYLPLNPTKNDSQGVGACITYLRRYSLSALVGVVCDDEDDGETAVGRGKQNNVPPQNNEPEILCINSAQIKEICALLNQLPKENQNAFSKWLKDTFGNSEVPKIPAQSYIRVLEAVKSVLKAVAS